MIGLDFKLAFEDDFVLTVARRVARPVRRLDPVQIVTRRAGRAPRRAAARSTAPPLAPAADPPPGTAAYEEDLAAAKRAYLNAFGGRRC